MCIKFDSNFFGLENDMFLIFVYMRQTYSTRGDINDSTDCYDLLFDQLAKLSEKGGVIVAGDMNARTGEREECEVRNCLDTNVIDYNISHEHAYCTNSIFLKMTLLLLVCL